jgi:3-oxoacyl-[acyl-carrier-protein] synthase-3
MADYQSRMNGNGHHRRRDPRLARALEPHTLRYAHVIGWGKALPARIMPNADFEKLVNTNDEWIYTRTGIRERRIAAEGETTTDLAIRAAERALDLAGVLPDEIDYIIVATSTPEHIFPSTASMVQDAIGATHAGANDLAAACSGFVYALDAAYQKIRTGSINTALVIGAETMSRVLDWTDRSTCILFGDGAGAVVLRGSDEPGGLISSVLHSEGTGWDLLTLPTVGGKETYLADGTRNIHTLYMDGKCVFQFATRAMTDGITEALDRAGLTPADLDVIVPHQANQRILEHAARALHVPLESIFSNLEHYGNTSAASIPIALAEAAEAGRLQPGNLVALAGFGGGLSWGAVVLEWRGPDREMVPALYWSRRQEQTIRTTVRRAYHRHYWRWMIYNGPRAKLRRWRRKRKTRQPRPTETAAVQV